MPKIQEVIKMTLTAMAAIIALICGFIIGAGVTLAWEWSRMRKVHRRYKGVSR